jgi:hypothetical protein
MKKLLFIIFLTTLFVSCDKNDGIEVKNTKGIDIISRIMPKGDKVVDEKRGEEVWLTVGALAGVDGVPANGVTQAHYFADGTYVHTIQLNIGLPEDGYFYEGWLVAGGKKPLSTGHLRSRFGDERHWLNFESDEDVREYTKVVVTLEPDDGDPAPAGHVAEGVLKERTR